MPTLDELQLPPPSDWQAFQRLCLSLWKKIWNDPNAQEYGGLGQRQNGVDIYGRPNGGPGHAAVQCKDKDNLSGSTLTVEEIRAEVKKAKKFEPKLDQYIIAFTGKRDVALQNEALRLSALNERKGLFSVIVWSWEDIRQTLSKFPDLLSQYSPELFTSTISNPNKSPEILQEVKDTSNQLGHLLSEEIRNSTAKLSNEFKTVALSSIATDMAFSKKLLDLRKPKTCLDFLDDYASKHWGQLSSIDKFKLLTNKASSHLQLDQYSQAAPLFIQALQYNKDDEKANVNAALGYVLLKDNLTAEKHIGITLAKNPLNVNAWSLRIQSVPDIQGLNSVTAQIPKPIEETTEVLWARGMMHLKFQQSKEAEPLIDRAVQNDSEKRVELINLLGSVRVKNLLDQTKRFGGLTFLPEETKSFEECAQLFTKVLQLTKDSEISSIKVDALSKRGRIERLIGDTDAAKRDFDQAIELDPHHYEAGLQRAMIFAEDNAFSEAIKRIQPFAEPENAYEAKLLLADTYRLAKDYSNVINVLFACESWATIETQKLHALMIVTDAHLEMNDIVSARESASKAEGVSSRSFIPYLLHARTERFASRITEAKTFALKAKGMLTSSVQFPEEWKLADELYFLDLFSDAADVFERIAIPEKNDQLTRGLIYAYYDSEQMDKALDACNRLLKLHPEVQYAAEIASAIYESVGNLECAANILQAYLAHKPDDQHAKLRLTMVLLRDGKTGDVDAELARIENPLSLNAKDARQYALIITNRGNIETAVKFLYELRRTHPNDPEIQMAYSGIVLMRSEHLSILDNPQEIIEDSVVFLEDADGNEEHYIIESRNDSDILKREVKVGDQIAKELLGKRVGDTVDLINNPFQKNLSTVKAIKSKYVHALHEILQNHQKQFPQRRELLSFRTPTDEKGNVDTAKLKQQFLSTLPDEEWLNTIEQFYRDQKLPLGVMSKVANRDLVSTLVYFSSKPDLGIFVSAGKQEGYVSSKILLDNRKGIVIDPISLLIVHFLEAKEFLSDKYGPLTISQSTIDHLNQIYELRSVANNRIRSTIYKHNGELYFHELSVEDRKRELDDLSGLIQWAQDECRILPVNLGLKMKQSEKERIDDLLGQPFFDSILLAKEHDYLLLTDDGVFRSFAEVQYSLHGIWTHAILNHAFDNGLIDEERFVDLTAKSISYNLQHIPINSQMLLRAADKSEWLSRPPLQFLLFNLTGFRCSEDSALTVAIQFLYEVWTKTLPSFAKVSLISALLDSLVAARDRKRVTRRFEQIIVDRFHLWPQAAERILTIIKTWKMAHLV